MLRTGPGRWLVLWTILWGVAAALVLVLTVIGTLRCEAQNANLDSSWCGLGTIVGAAIVGLVGLSGLAGSTVLLLAAWAAGRRTPRCPACRAPSLPGGTICPDCGHTLDRT
jgi:hypothetical protein